MSIHYSPSDFQTAAKTMREELLDYVSVWLDDLNTVLNRDMPQDLQGKFAVLHNFSETNDVRIQFSYPGLKTHHTAALVNYPSRPDGKVDLFLNFPGHAVRLDMTNDPYGPDGAYAQLADLLVKTLPTLPHICAEGEVPSNLKTVEDLAAEFANAKLASTQQRAPDVMGETRKDANPGFTKSTPRIWTFA